MASELKITPVLENAEVEEKLKRMEAAFQNLYSALQKNDMGEAFSKQMSEMAETAQNGEAAIKDLFSSIGDQSKQAKSVLKEMRTSLEATVESLKGLEGAEDAIKDYNEFIEAIDKVTEELDENSGAVDDAIDKYNELADSQRDVANASDDAVDALRSSYDFILGKTQDLEGTIKKVYQAYGRDRKSTRLNSSHII